jgi:flagellar biosynthesis/type III secretory pathway chaperone
MSPLDYALDELRTSLVEFVRLLEHESEALQNVQADDLAAIVEQKNRWSDAANAAWNRLLVASAIDRGRGESLEAAFAAVPALRAKWLEVRHLAETADRLNQSNNILIEAQLRRTRQALDVLQSAANRSSLYGANGEMVDAFQSRHTLDKA